MTRFFSGEKGSSSSFTQRPDTLRSNDVFEGVLGICAGPIKGLANGLKSLKINGTPVEDASGTANFKEMVVTISNGDPALHPQKIELALGSGGAPTTVNASLPNTNTSGTVPGDWVSRSVTNLNAAFIDLRFVVSQLYTQDKEGVREATANLEIQMKPTGMTTWINPSLATPTSSYSASGITVAPGIAAHLLQENFTGGGSWVPEANNGYLDITGKTMSPYVKELRVMVPNTGAYANVGWDIRVRLREPANIDDDPNFTKRTISWESISAGYTTTLGDAPGWQGVATTRVYGKATDDFQGIPTYEGIYDTKLVSVPPSGVYNPTTRQYTGAFWDGSFSKAYTNDPAWVINDVLADGIFGISSLAPGSYLNKWDALEVSKWCSELVWDGDSGTHPRYSLNFRSEAPQKANEFVQYLAGAVGGFAWDNGNGEWRIKVDKPEAPSDIVTLETIEGEFSYSHTDISTRYNDITVVFQNEEMDFREDRVRVYDEESIELYGRKPTTIVGVGCTNRQEAVRRGHLRLRASKNETRMVNYVTNRRGRLLTPFCTILIADSDLGYLIPDGATTSADVDPFNNRTTGRVTALDGPRTTLTLRDTVRLELGVTYVLHFAIPNPGYTPDATTQPSDPTWDQPTISLTRTIVNSSAQRGDTKTLYLGSALPAGTPEFLAVAIEASGLPAIPKLYRVLGLKIDEQSPERVAVSAIEVDPGKWAAADAATAGSVYYEAPDGVVPMPLLPSSGPMLSILRVPGDGPDIINLAVSWQRPASRFLSGFKVQYRVNDGPLIVAADNLQDTQFELVNPVQGKYTVEVLSRDRRGNYSAPLTDTIDVESSVSQMLRDMLSDGILSANEKGALIRERLSIVRQHEELVVRADELERAAAEKAASAAAIAALDAYLESLDPPWDDVTVDTPIDGPLLISLFDDCYQALAAFQIAVSDGALLPTEGPGNISDETGRYWYAGELLNGEISLLGDGHAFNLGYVPAPAIPRVTLSRVTPIDFGAATREAEKKTQGALDTLSAAVMRLADEAGRTRDVFRDAGIYIDPETGTARIYAVDETADRVNNVEFRMSASEAAITLKASTVYVDNAIASAVIDPSQIPVFAGIEASINAVEIDLSALTATVALKASAVVLTGVEARVTSAETAIDALEGTITTKVDSATFTALDSRVASAETSLSALGDTAEIANTVTASRALRRLNDANAQNALGALLNGDLAKQYATETLAQARQELKADIVDGVSAEASARLALAAQVAENEALLTTESVARASGDSALASQVTSLTATVGANKASVDTGFAAQATTNSAVATSITNLNAAITTEGATRAAAIAVEQQARVDQDVVLAGIYTSLAADLEDEVSTRSAALTTEQQARIDADDVLASSVTSISANLDDEIADRAAAISTEASARASGDTVLAASISTLSASLSNEVGNRVASVSAEEGARITADSALAGSITTITTNLNNEISARSAAVSSEASARINADNAISSTVTSLSTTVGSHTSSITSFASSIDGINAKAGIRLDTNNRVTGWVLNNNGAQAGMDIVADYLRVWGTGLSAPQAPFEIDTVNDLVRIRNASIKNAAIDTLKLADGAVTDSQQAYNGSLITPGGTGTWVSAILSYVYMTYSGKIILLSTAKQDFTNNQKPWSQRLLIDGSQVAYTWGTAFTDSVALSGKLDISISSPRWVPVELQVASDVSVKIPAGLASIVPLRSYK
jgi:hypothetical protein